MKQVQYKITGMSQDSAYQIFNPDKAYYCKNIRFFKTNEDMSLVRMTNEQGNTIRQNIISLITSTHNSINDTVHVNTWGVCEVPDNYLIFASYKVGDSVLSTDLILSKNGIVYEGNDFHFSNEVQSVCLQENDKLTKVYFTDGVNTMKVIDITALNTTNGISNNKFELLPDFYPIQMSVSKSFGGRFHSGMLQYAVTYVNENLQETNIVQVTPLYVIGANDGEGAAADDICNVSFKITISDYDEEYDYIRIYGILRTSLDTEPQVYMLEDISLKDVDSTITYIDTGANWESYNASELVLKQRERFIAKYMTQYGNRLFLANFKLVEQTLDFTSNNELTYLDHLRSNLHIAFHDIGNEGNATDNMTFRSNEWYRIGVQFSNNYGTKSKVYYLDDILMDTLDPVSMTLLRKTVELTLPQTAVGLEPFTKARLMMVDRSLLPHRSLCQGVLCPTVYRVQDRVDNLPFAMSSWSMRGINNTWRTTMFPTSGPDAPLISNTNKRVCELQNQQEYPYVTDVDYSDASNDLPPEIVRDYTYTGTGTKYFAYIEYDYTAPLDSSLPNWSSSNIVYRLYESDSDNSDYLDNTIAAEITIPCTTAFADPSMKTLGGLIDDFEIRMYNYIDTLGTFYQPRRLVDILVNQMKSLYSASSQTEDYTGYTRSWIWSSNINVPVFDGDGIMTLENAHEAARMLEGKPFICDHNILTFHSPDVEKQGDVIDNNPNVKYRIVGYTEMKEHYFDYYLDVTAPQDVTSEDALQGLAKDDSKVTYNAYLWGSHGYKFPVYIWNRTQALNSQIEPEDGLWYSQVIKKVMCNKHICGTVKGFSKRENATDTPIYFEGVDNVDSIYHSGPVFPKMGIPRYFNSNEVVGLSLEKQRNSLNIYNSEVYQGNVDLMHSSPFDIPIKQVNGDDTVIFHPNGGDAVHCGDAIWMRYKSTPHIVMPMSFITCGDDVLAPSLPALWGAYTSYEPMHGAYMWSDNVHGFLRSTIGDYVQNFSVQNLTDGLSYEILYVAEMYLDLNVDDIYPDEDSSSQLWIPISDWGDMFSGGDNEVLVGYGDTYLGNWDCLKTYAFSEDDMQQYKDVTSLTLESDINPVGRYDKFKNSDTVLHVNTTNFNLYNDVYNQKNNMFTYRNTAKEINSFSTQLFYSQIKTYGEKVDTWCQVNPISVLDVEGVRGEITGLTSNNSGVYVFQKKAVSKINSNTRVAIPTSDGVPVTLGNNNQVDTPHLLTTNYGVEEQKFITILDDSVYFLNNEIHHDLIAIGENDSMMNLSINGGMHTYLRRDNEESLRGTYPERIISDSEMKEIYIQMNDKNTSLCYSTLMGGFTSFYSYGPYKYMLSCDDKIYGVTDKEVYSQRDGDYNYFFNSYNPYYIEVIANMEPLDVKTFTNVEYNMDSFTKRYDGATNSWHFIDTAQTFDYIKAEDSYQLGYNDISFDKYSPSLLKRKLRVWRVDIPRNNNSFDRITDTWCKIQLSKKAENKYKSQWNYINITYYKK